MLALRALRLRKLLDVMVLNNHHNNNSSSMEDFKVEEEAGGPNEEGMAVVVVVVAEHLHSSIIVGILSINKVEVVSNISEEDNLAVAHLEVAVGHLLLADHHGPQVPSCTKLRSLHIKLQQLIQVHMKDLQNHLKGLALHPRHQRQCQVMCVSK